MKFTNLSQLRLSSPGFLRSAVAGAMFFSAGYASAADTYIWTGAGNSVLNAGANYQGNPVARFGYNTTIPNGGQFNTVIFSGDLTGNKSTNPLVTGNFHIGTVQFTSATGTGPITISPSGDAPIRTLNVYTSVIVDSGAGENTFEVDLGLGDRSVTLTNNSNNALVFSGNILGGSGVGVLALTNGAFRVQNGAKSYDGEVKIQNAATLVLSAANFTSANSRVTVESGGKLAGNGSIGGSAGPVIIAGGGVLQVGDSANPGTLAIGGDLSVGSGALTLLSLASETSYSQLTVAGILNYGGELRLDITGDFLNGVTQGSVFNLISGFESYSGALDSITFYDAVAGKLGELSSVDGTVWSGTVEGVQFDFNAGSGSLSVVPEPHQTGLLLMSGGFAVALALRKRRGSMSGSSV